MSLTPEVDAALAQLDRLVALPLAEHVGAFEAIHRQLRLALSDSGEPLGGSPQPA